MVDFASISLPVPNGMRHKIIKRQHQAVSSAGYTMSRPAGTVAKFEFEITWKMLTQTQRTALETFFNTNQGNSFNWTHPESGGATHAVMFAMDEIDFEWVPPYWSTRIILREI